MSMLGAVLMPHPPVLLPEVGRGRESEIAATERAMRAAAEADFVICLYNPGSKKRADYLKKACEMILEFRRPETVCGIVRNIGRDGETYEILSLEQLRDTQVDMFTTVFIGNSNTMELNGRMVTPRGYKDV